MELSIQVFNQVVVIFILMMTGALLYKLKILSDDGSAQMTKLLLNVVMPCVIIDAFQTEFNPEILKSLLIATGLSVVLHIIAIVLAALLFHKNTPKNAVNIFGSVYSNCGFMGFPLLTAVFGSEGIFYGSAYFTIFTVLSWTHGVYIYGKKEAELNVKKIILNPGIIGVIIGVSLFLIRIELPYVAGESIGYISMLNTPLAMLVLGTHMAKIKLKDITDKLNLTLVTLLKLVLVPMAGIFIARFFGITGDVTGAVIILAACPTAAVSTLFASRYNCDAVYSTVTVVITTLLSIISLPLLITLL